MTAPIPETKPIGVNFLQYYDFPQGAVVSDVFMAPYILWYANRPTVASPYHRNVEGIMDNHEILMNPDMVKVAELLKKHQVGSIVLPLDIDKKYYVSPEENVDKLYGKMLSSHEYPAWLTEDVTAHPWNYVVLKVLREKLP